MVNKIVLLLSMTLNLVLALIVFENNRPVKALGFRDAVADIHARGRSMSNSLASVTPVFVPPVEVAQAPVAPSAAAPVPVPMAPQAVPLAPVQASESVEAPVAAEVPVAPVAPIKTAALMIRGGNDWAAYKQDAANDGDVFVSNIFRSRKNGERAVVVAVKRTKARGRGVLFSCVLRAKSGGVFYIIRMTPRSVHPPLVAVAPRKKPEQEYSTDIGVITNQTESETQVMY